MQQTDINHSISAASTHLNILQKLSLTIVFIGLLSLTLGIFNIYVLDITTTFAVAIGALSIGTLGFTYASYKNTLPGIKNDGVWFRSISNKGVVAWLIALALTVFYVLLYWYPSLLGLGDTNTGLIAIFDPLSQFLKGEKASEWFVYGTLYTLAILLMGIKFIWKYRHNNYQIVRTLSIMFFQTSFAFLLPEFLQALKKPYYDFKNMWPLNYYFFDEWHINKLTDSGTVGLIMLGFGIAMIFIISPILTYFYGKRWYCSWVCGCGGLAETAGDAFRQVSDKSETAWRIERWMIHGVLLFSTIMTIGVIYALLHNNPEGYYLTKTHLLVIEVAILGFFLAMVKFKPDYFQDLDPKAKKYFNIAALVIIGVTLLSYFVGSHNAMFVDSYMLRNWYGFLIGSAFSGVVGVGFYPILGNRVWCRFGCPMAAILGLQQKFFSRFRITTNGGQCISCGNCSTYCEMGIDVRAYAQKGQDIVRSSCVGCGICSAVCPRGVLRLENGPNVTDKTIEQRTIHITSDQVKLLN